MKKKAAGVLGLQVMVCILMVGMWTSTVAVAQPYAQLPMTLNAKDVLPQELLQGENYKVVPDVSNDGLINTYQLETDYGPLTVESTSLMMIRIAELNALQVMEEMDRKGVFGKAMVEGAKAPIKGAAQMVKAPVETTKGIVKGTGRFLSNLGRSIVSDDPHQSNAFAVAVGYDAAKRSFAYEFGINPYSSYEPAMDRLGQIARAAVAGGITTKVAVASVDHTLATVARISGTAQGMKKLVRDNAPGALEKINRKKLEDMGLKEDLIEAFLDNYRYNPEDTTRLVGALETMTGVEGRDVFIAVANLAAEESVALFYRSSAEMMAAYHQHITPIVRIRNDMGSLGAQKEDGGLVLIGPIDHVFWTEHVESRLNAIDDGIAQLGGISSKELWITGTFDPEARKQWEAKGWKVKADANTVLIKE